MEVRSDRLIKNNSNDEHKKKDSDTLRYIKLGRAGNANLNWTNKHISGQKMAKKK